MSNFVSVTIQQEAMPKKLFIEKLILRLKQALSIFPKTAMEKIIGLNICGSVQLKSWNAYRLTIWIFRLKTKSMSAYFQPRYYDVVAESIRRVQSP